MKYTFIAAHRDEFPISRMCQVLAVSRSGYYAWCARPISAREMANQALLVKIKALFDQHKGRYGSIRIHRALRREGERCSLKRVARLMRPLRYRGSMGCALGASAVTSGQRSRTISCR